MTVDSRVSGVGQLAADHELGELLRRGLGGPHGAHGRPGAQHGDDVGDPQHLVELVADERHGHALGAQVGQRGEQRVDLLRDEHGGRLVEHDHAGAAVEHLEDLDALAVADAEVLDEGVGVDVEAVPGTEVADPRARGGPVEAAAAGGLGAEDDVLEHGQVVGQHEVLVHHADARRDGVGRAGEAHGRAVDADRPLVGALHPVDDLHERGLAGAVLPDDGVHLAGHEAQGHVAVGDDAGEALGHAGQLDDRDGSGLGHAHLSDSRTAPAPRSLHAVPGPVGDYGVVGTVISPLSILAASSSSWGLMSSTKPPDSA